MRQEGGPKDKAGAEHVLASAWRTWLCSLKTFSTVPLDPQSGTLHEAAGRKSSQATKCAKYREANLRCLGQSLRDLLGQLLATLTAKRHSSRAVPL